MVAKTYFPYKAASRMDSGPHRLTARNATLVPATHGVYLLLDDSESGTPIVCYVGRSDSLPRRLAAWIGQYTYFYFKVTEDEDSAYLAECAEYHRYEETRHLDNRIHPALPEDSDLPPCSELGCPG